MSLNKKTKEDTFFDEKHNRLKLCTKFTKYSKNCSNFNCGVLLFINFCCVYELVATFVGKYRTQNPQILKIIKDKVQKELK